MDLKFTHAWCLILAIAALSQHTVSAQPNQLTPGQIFPTGQKCPDIACTLELIPEPCREVPTIQINGHSCPGCPRWKSACVARGTTAPLTPCPVLSCPPLAVSKDCQTVDTYEYNGRQCPSCPKEKADCSDAAVGKTLNAVCPPRPCPLIFIPTECRDVPTIDINGLKCEGCPKWRVGCIPNSASINVAQAQQSRPVSTILQREVACPMIACDSYTPKECQVTNQFQFQGKLCQGCPGWREGCREAERRAHAANPSIGRTFPDTPVACPEFKCSINNISPSCLELQPFEYKGKTCYRCPRMKEGCVQNNLLNGVGNISPEVPCPLIRCQAVNVPEYCLEKQTYQFNGRLCQQCPTVKSDCRVLESISKPVVDLSQTQPETVCPPRRCALIKIPAECMEISTFEFQGKTCEGCPRFKPGCVPNINAGLVVNPTTINSNTMPEAQVACPIVGCPKIYIPSECKVEQPYQFQGKTCYGCPKRRENCTVNPIQPNSNLPVILPDVECPPMMCNRMFIPEECRETQSFEFQGRTCYSCPTFRKGCVPGSNTADLTGPNKLANFTSAEPLVKPLDGGPTSIPEVACPSIQCQKLDVPSDCLEVHFYPFMDKTCLSCPTVKPGCANHPERWGINGKSCPVPRCAVIDIPPECIEMQTVEVNGLTCPMCPKRKAGCQGQGEMRGGFTGPQAACPSLRCEQPADRIPQECIERKSFQFQGRTCYECPRWREGCTPNTRSERVNNPDIVYSAANVQQQEPSAACPDIDCRHQLNTIPRECQEKESYMYRGVTCYSCPRWRQGCVPSNDQSSGSVNQPQTSQPTSQPSNPGTARPRISDLRGIIPIARFMSAVQASVCPRLPCPAVNIPPQCRESSSYIYNSISCPGCPTWKRGCRSGTPGRPNLNVNGILAYSLYDMMT